MKTKWILVLSALLMAWSCSAGATPYFRLMSHDAQGYHPQLNAGTFLDVADPTGGSTGGMSVSIITHSPKDGCLLPGIVCEDWSPLSIGWSLGAGKNLAGIGPVLNVMPWAKSFALMALNTVAPGKAPNLRGLLAPVMDSQGLDLSMAISPLWAYGINTDKGYFRIFTGAAVKF